MPSNYQAYLLALCFSCALKMSVLKAFPFLWTIGTAKEPFQCVRSIVQRLRRICAIDSNSIKEAITSSAPVIPILKTPLSDWLFICLSRNPCCCGNSEVNAVSLIEKSQNCLSIACPVRLVMGKAERNHRAVRTSEMLTEQQE